MPPAGMLRRAALLIALAASAAQATDVGFWRPYRDADQGTYLLLSFDEANGLPAGEANVGKLERGAGVSFDPQGRFGRALRLTGKGGLRCDATAIFPGPYLAVEAWVKLERLPEKRAFIVLRPAQVDANPKYDPKADVTKGFALFVDAQGALHLETTNCGYGKTVRTSSPQGAVPTGRWVHLAATSCGFPESYRRLYVDGHEVAAVPITWGQGIQVHREEEQKPGPLFIGAGADGSDPLTGWLDQVRVHRRVPRFWPLEDAAWTRANRPGQIPIGPPHFLESHRPVVHLPLDGSTAAQGTKKIEVTASGRYAPGVCGQAHVGKLELRADSLLDLHHGSLECWLQPVGVNNYSDRNVGFVAGPFIFYIYNSSGIRAKPLALYFTRDDGRLHFVRAPVDVRPGKWYHLAITWKRREIAVYVDGERLGHTFDASLATIHNHGTASVLSFPARESLIDEVFLYPRALSPTEVANAFHRYRDRAKLAPAPEEPAVDLLAQYLPSHRQIHYALLPNLPDQEIREVQLALATAAGKELLRKSVPLAPAERVLDLPDLPDGTYTLAATATLRDGAKRKGGSFAFRRHHFPWEGNRLGITDEVYAPFKPVATEGNRVRIVGREHAMNGFGLWDTVVTEGRDILAAPIRLVCETAAGTAKWTFGKAQWAERGTKAAVWTATAATDALRVATRSRIEIDGCMRVEMQLLPGPRPAEIRSLRLEIPVKDREAPLMHAIADGLRHNHAGLTPAGQGVVWDGSKARRYGAWRNAFVPYVWLGAEERGIACFAENDQGWLTEKAASKTPTHQLIRRGGRLTLRLSIVNHPATIAEPRSIVLGLQASPTKPMPTGWRARLPHIPGGLAVVPWGGLQCASQAPFRDDWSIADKIAACRDGTPFDAAWAKAYADANHPPHAHGTWPWLSAVAHFAGRVAAAGPGKPIAVYQEEMRGCLTRPEWAVFQDEWTTQPDRYARTALPDRVFQHGYDTRGGAARITFQPSYQDFATSIANEWLRRGVSLYWDNTYPTLATNPRTTAAYRCDDGHIQPCLVLWNQRRYAMRTWHLLQHWRRRRSEPLEFTHHMTNTLVLPIHTWGTVDLDHELGRDTPFPPDWLRTETTGRQIGNFPLSLYPVSGKSNALLAKAPAAHRERTEWAMRIVHEIQHNGTPDKIVTDFGYGTPAVQVHPYWAERPVLAVAPETVKWIALAKPATGELLIVLASWDPKAVTARLTVSDPALAARLAAAHAIDAETAADLAAPQGEPAAFTVPLQAPYGARIVRLAPPPPGAP